MNMEKPLRERIISKHSDYNAHNPYWICLGYHFNGREHADMKQKISDSLNRYFKKHGPDANEDYAGCSGPLMQHETAINALNYALNANSSLIRHLPKEVQDGLPHCLIDGGGSSVEEDGRKNDPVTGELLHAIPINEDSVLEELEYLLDQDEMSKDDWVWCDFVLNSFSDDNSEINAMLNRIARKFR